MKDIPDNIDTETNLPARVERAARETGLAIGRVVPLIEIFQPLANQAAVAIAAAGYVAEGEVEAAKEARTALKKVRCAVEAKRKEEKADSLKLGRAIDDVAKVITNVVEPVEAAMEAIEKAEEIKAEQAKLARSNARREELAAIGGVAPDALLLMEMTDQAWSDYITGAKVAKERREAEAAKVAAEAAAREAERQAREDRMRSENARLLAEARAAASNRRAETEKAVSRAGIENALATVKASLAQFGVTNLEQGVLKGAEMVEQIDRLKKQHQTVSAEALPDIAKLDAELFEANQRHANAVNTIRQCQGAEISNTVLSKTVAGLKLCAKCREKITAELAEDLQKVLAGKAMNTAALPSCEAQVAKAQAALDAAVKAQAQKAEAIEGFGLSIQKHQLVLASLKDLMAKQEKLTAELSALDAKP